MVTTLCFGDGQSCELDVDRISHLRAAPSRTLSDAEIVVRIRTALAEPIAYPPLAEASVPGDRVVVAIGPGVASNLAIVEGALAALRDAGVESSLISLVVPTGFAGAELREKLSNLGGADGFVTVHDPDAPGSTAMLGVTRAGQAIRLNRQLCNADLVLSIGAASTDHGTSFNGWFPHFSDRETISRLDAPLAHDAKSLRDARTQEVAEAAWLLGVGMLVEIVPGPGGSIVQVLAGESATVTAKSQQLYREIWSCTPVSSADLVIATLVGGPSEQTWKNLGRALGAAAPLLSEDASIAIYSELSDSPGKAFESLVGNEDYDLADREIMRAGLDDSWSAWQLCRALRHGPVYMRSHLPDQVVESLGITPIAMDDELERLACAHDHTIVLEEAQHLLPIQPCAANGSFAAAPGI